MGVLTARIAQYDVDLDTTSLGFGLGLLKIRGTLELGRRSYDSLKLRVAILRRGDGATIFSRSIELRHEGRSTSLAFATEFSVPVEATQDAVRVDLWLESVVRETSAVRSTICGRRPPPARIRFDGLRPGQLFDNDRYRVDRKIAEDEKSALYLASHTVLGRKCALKLVPHEHFGELSQSVAEVSTRGVVRVSDIGVYPGIAFALFSIDADKLDERFVAGEDFKVTLVAPLARALEVEPSVAAELIQSIHGVQPPTSGTIE